MAQTAIKSPIHASGVQLFLACELQVGNCVFTDTVATPKHHSGRLSRNTAQACVFDAFKPPLCSGWSPNCTLLQNTATCLCFGALPHHHSLRAAILSFHSGPFPQLHTVAEHCYRSVSCTLKHHDSLKAAMLSFPSGGGLPAARCRMRLPLICVFPYSNIATAGRTLLPVCFLHSNITTH